MVASLYRAILSLLHYQWVGKGSCRVLFLQQWMCKSFRQTFADVCSQARSSVKCVLKIYLDFVQTWPGQRFHSEEWWRGKLVLWQATIIHACDWRMHIKVSLAKFDQLLILIKVFRIVGASSYLHSIECAIQYLREGVTHVTGHQDCISVSERT